MLPPNRPSLVPLTNPSLQRDTTYCRFTHASQSLCVILPHRQGLYVLDMIEIHLKFFCKLSRQNYGVYSERATRVHTVKAFCASVSLSRIRHSGMMIPWILDHL
jgi:hypothetical protein